MKKRLLSLLLAAACLMPLSGCNWGEEPEETYDTLSQYYQQSDSTKQDTRLTSFGLPYLQGETWDPITCADGAQQTLGALLYESLYTLGTDFLPQPCLAESASYDAESYALTVTVRSGVTFSDGSALTAWDVVAWENVRMDTPLSAKGRRTDPAGGQRPPQRQAPADGAGDAAPTTANHPGGVYKRRTRRRIRRGYRSEIFAGERRQQYKYFDD